MTELVSTMADKIDRTMQRVIPLAYRVRRTGRRLVRRALRKPRSVSEGPNLLPLLNQKPRKNQKGEERKKLNN